MALRDVFLAISKEMRARFERTSQIPHRGERGREREKIVMDFLSNHLPKQYSVDRGFIIASNNQKSPQQDVVIYDELNNPLISRFATLKLFPIESVYAIMEVKSLLDKREVRKTFENIRFVKKFPTVGGFRKTMLETIVYPPPPPPIGIVFAFDSKISLAKLMEILKEFRLDVDPDCVINIVCIFDKGIIVCGNSLKFKVSQGPSERLEILDSRENTLHDFYIILDDYLNSTEVRIVNIRAYSGISSQTSWIQEAIDSLS